MAANGLLPSVISATLNDSGASTRRLAARMAHPILRSKPDAHRMYA
jgi:hypothetical protein